MGGLGELKRVAELVFAGRLRPVVDARFPLAEVSAAHARLEQRAAFGKILLEVGGGR
jgi:NADPH:quinone reductase-like Zn-dependent oxidoreductase